MGSAASPLRLFENMPAPIPAPQALVQPATDGGSIARISPAPAPTGSPAEPLIPTADQADPLKLVEILQAQIHELHDEVTNLRQRDQTLHYYLSRVDDEMRLAARLQQDFLPKTLPQVGSVYFHTLFRPAGYVSGDLYDVMRLDETHIGFYMADAVGHGMPAALLTMFIKNALVTKEITAGSYRLLDPGQAMSRLNDALVGQNLSYATFATAIYGLINTETLQVTFARGGHPNPVLLRADGSMSDQPADGSLLGIFANETFESRTVQLETGDRLIILSDGVEVAFGSDGAACEKVDTHRWREELLARRSLPSEQLLLAFADHIDKESGSLRPKDDLTMIVIDVR